jgi:hypothetical protein
MDGVKDALKLCLAKVKTAATKEEAIKDLKVLLSLARQGKTEKIKELLRK